MNFHILIAAGAVALYARKGAPLHRKAGWFFVCAMLAMSASGAVMATVQTSRGNFNARKVMQQQLQKRFPEYARLWRQR